MIYILTQNLIIKVHVYSWTMNNHVNGPRAMKMLIDKKAFSSQHLHLIGPENLIRTLTSSCIHLLQFTDLLFVL